MYAPPLAFGVGSMERLCGFGQAQACPASCRPLSRLSSWLHHLGRSSHPAATSESRHDSQSLCACRPRRRPHQEPCCPAHRQEHPRTGPPKYPHAGCVEVCQDHGGAVSPVFAADLRCQSLSRGWQDDWAETPRAAAAPALRMHVLSVGSTFLGSLLKAAAVISICAPKGTSWSCMG